MQAEGYFLEELFSWETRHHLEVCHWFTADVLGHPRRGERVSAGTAVLGTTLQIKLLLHVSQDGEVAVVEKPRGRKQATKAPLVRNGKNRCGVMLIRMVHMPYRKLFRRNSRKRMSSQRILGHIGACTGPGMLALIYWGPTR